MKQQTIQKMDINKLADRIEKNQYLELYWDYRDSLSEEQILKILKEEEGLNEVEQELIELNYNYAFEIIDNAIKEELTEEELNSLTEEEKEELRYECESRFNFNIKDLIKNSEIRLRVTLETNEDMICFVDNLHKGSQTIKEFKRVFRGKYKKEDLESEINNIMNDYANFTFFFKVRGLSILELREELFKGYLTLRKGFNFGLFNSWVGGGSVLEMELQKEVTLNLKDWRLKNQKEEIIQNLKEEKESYWNVSIKGDNISKYGIQEVYGLTGECWVEW